ncbi:MAG TPA: tetratricopeptide repeat protein [Pyrinomonadaceae bacterium]|jgi:tetratricopeptide (TPR) repeat protein|nr:tetratricopeptide repeat protein [Pyrinomonadaceae bacterium]
MSQIQPSDAELRVMLEAGFVLREAGKLDEAEAVFRGAMELLPVSDVPRVALGTVELQRGRFPEALAACEEALRVRPESLYARVHHAEALLFQGRREEADAELQQVIAADPNSPHSRTARALIDAADLICSSGAGAATSGTV